MFLFLTGVRLLSTGDPGVVGFNNFRAPTRLGSLDGPLAGPGIWGQLLAGPTGETLVPIGIPVEHSGSGIINGGDVEAPNIRCGTSADVQMVAWDGYWGTELETGPPDQLGYTDIVRHGFACQVYDPVGVPDFTQPAVVPIIPEPSSLTLLGIGSVAVMAGFARRRQGRSGASTNTLS